MARVGQQRHRGKESNMNCQNLINRLAVVTSTIVDVGRFHPFNRPRRPLGRVEV
jgi:hypothetical protein